MKDLSKDELLKMYYYMVLTRKFEEIMANLYHIGKINEVLHRSLGQEAVGVGATFCLEEKDFVLPSLRTRAAFFVKGMDLNAAMADVYAKRISPSKGRETSHHSGIPELGIILGSGLVGSSIPVGVGVALGTKLQGTDQVTICFFGDGATSRGDFHEGVNLAATMDLPIIFVCENNQYAMSTPQFKEMKVKDIVTRASGYGIPGVKVDGQDVLDVYRNVQEAIFRARKGIGPTLVECKTYRFAGHSEHDVNWDMGRPEKEFDYWRKRDPIKIFEKYLKEHKFLDDKIKKEIERKIDQELKNAIEYAERSPDPVPDDLLEDVYA